MNWSHRVPFLPRVHENRSHMVNAETSADSPVCTPPSVTAITIATIAAATIWWAAHGLLSLCTPLHTPFACPPAPPSAPPSMAPIETQHKSNKERLSQKNLLYKIRYWIQNNRKFCKLNTRFRIYQVFLHRNLRRRVIPM